MKKTLILLLMLVLSLTVLAGCGATENNDPSCSDILNDVMSNSEEFDTLFAAGDETLENNYDSMYAVKRDLVDDCAIIYLEKGGTANELSLLHLKDPGDVQLAKDKLQDRLDTRKNQFAGYKPEEVYKLENAVIMSQGNFVALIVSQDPPMLEASLRQAISDNE